MKNIIKKIKENCKNYAYLRAGMSYVELIVVLSIFSIMSSILLFNYGEFQAKVDIKNLASDIALKIVEAQKSSLAGVFPPLDRQALIPSPSTWKPSYGVYFNKTVDNKSFIYFTDLNQNNILEDTSCALSTECLNKITITKGNTISSLNLFYQNDPTVYNFNDLTITFFRPNSNAIVTSSSPITGTVLYVQINILSPKGSTAKIKLYPSGRVQVN